MLELMNAHQLAAFGEADATAEELRRWLTGAVRRASSATSACSSATGGWSATPTSTRTREDPPLWWCDVKVDPGRGRGRGRRPSSSPGWSSARTRGRLRSGRPDTRRTRIAERASPRLGFTPVAALLPDGDRARRRRRGSPRWPDGIARSHSCARTSTQLVYDAGRWRSGATHSDPMDETFEEWSQLDDRARGVRPVAVVPGARRRRARRLLALHAEHDRSERRLRRDARRPPAVAQAGARRGAAPALVRGVPRARLDSAGRSASTRRARPARPGSTSAPACASTATRSSWNGRLVREPAPRALPRLPDADRGRARPRVPVPHLRPRVRAPGSCACPARGGRRRGDGRGGAPRAAATRRRPWSRRTRSRSRTSRSPPTCPARPLVLGGCCCSHVGAIEALSAGEDRLAVVWLDAHGDLNTPETSPSGNAWGMPLRMLIDAGAVAAARRRARRRAQPRSARGRVHRAERRPDRRRRDRAGARGRRRASTSRSTATRSIPARWPSSCRSRTASGWPRSRHCSRDLAGRTPCRRPRLHRARPERGERAEARAARGGARRVANLPPPSPGLRSHDVRIDPDRRLDRAQAGRPSRRQKKHPNTCPGCGSHYRDDELEARVSGSARSAATTSRCARASGSSSWRTRAASSRRRPTSAPPIRSSSSTCAPYTERLAEAEVSTGLGDAMVIGAGDDRGPVRASSR